MALLFFVRGFSAFLLTEFDRFFTLMTNPISFVSLGPGEAGLVSLKGRQRLVEADCIFCPQTVARTGHTVSRAADIVSQLGVPAGALCFFRLPMSKERGAALLAYRALAAEARRLWMQGKRVCIVAEGDAGFYSSVHYVFERLREAGIPVEHVPGIPAFIAAGALAGLHVASQDERLTVAPGNISADEVAGLVEAGGTVVVMKLSQCADEMRRCITLHPGYSYHYFENVGTAGEVCLHEPESIVARQFPYFSLLIVKRPL